MIDFRYHIVSIVAVFLALALGLFLGSTTLQGTVLNGITNKVNQVTQENSRINAELNATRAQVNTQDQFLQAVAPFAVSNVLPQETVGIVVAPGVDGSVVDAVEKIIQQAGATVTSRVQLDTNFFDPSQDTLLANLAQRLDPATVTLPNTGGAAQAAALLAAALAAKPSRPAMSQTRIQSILSSYVAAKVLAVNGAIDDVRAANLTVLLAPGPGALLSGHRQADTSLLIGLATALAHESVGAVLGAPLSALASGGVLQEVRSSGQRPDNLATADSTPTIAGQIALTFGLVEVFDGRSGDFGPGSNPPLPAAPTPNP